MNIYKLITTNNTKIRIGKTGWNDSDDMIHSDTLFSALINCYVLLYGQDKVKNFISEFENGNIKISSVFYSVDIFENKNFIKTINFLPKPFLRIQPLEQKKDENPADTKKIKKIKFVSEKLFSDIIENYDINSGISNTDLIKNRYAIGDEFCCCNDELEISFKKSFKNIVTETKNAIDRETAQVKIDEQGKGQLFTEINIELTEIKENNYILKPALYFFADIKSDFEKQFNASIRLMCEEGLGGERSFGKGLFKGLKITENHKTNFKNPSNIFVNLSLLNPQNELELFKNSVVNYDSIIRGGWIDDIRKKNVRMVKEGSVLKNKINGQLVDVSTNKFNKHNIYQNGIGFYL